ncbi:MAG: hypothetical protein WC322_02685 [Candidatus Paceibacterota bacterium]|jgi:predicted nuclease with TOPRIM domain
MDITPEIQEAIDAAVEAATTGLKSKNTELLGELKKARKAGEITPEQLESVEAERDKLQADLSKIQKDYKKATTDLETANKSLESESGFTKNLLVENGLIAELIKNDVNNPALQKAAIALLKGNVKVEVDGDTRVAKYGDKPMADAIKEWASSDEGKNFVTAPANSGGGAQGGAGKVDTKAAMALNPVERMAAGRPQIVTSAPNTQQPATR